LSSDDREVGEGRGGEDGTGRSVTSGLRQNYTKKCQL